MAVTVTINGSTYSVPSQSDPAPWGTYITSVIQALSSNVLYKNGGSFTLTANANFGTDFSLIGLFNGVFTSSTANPATAGALRLASGDVINFRNVANNGNVSIALDGTNAISIANLAVTGSTVLNTMNAASILSPIFTSATALPASVGTLRLANTDVISWRNAANNADISLSLGADDTFGMAALDVTGDLEANTLTAVAGATLANCSVTGDLGVGDDLTVADDVTVGVVGTPGTGVAGKIDVLALVGAGVGGTGTVIDGRNITLTRFGGTAGTLVCGQINLQNTSDVTTISLGGFTGIIGAVSASLSATTNQLVLGTTNTTTISAPAPASSITLTLPTTAGTIALTSQIPAATLKEEPFYIDGPAYVSTAPIMFKLKHAAITYTKLYATSATAVSAGTMTIKVAVSSDDGASWTEKTSQNITTRTVAATGLTIDVGADDLVGVWVSAIGTGGGNIAITLVE